jgi:hypothetical protein
VLRGTLRYPGWCETLEALLRLGLLDVDTSSPLGPSYCDLLDRHLPAGSGPLPKRIARFLELPENHPVLDRMAWLGLFSQLPVPDEARCPLDALACGLILDGEIDLTGVRIPVHESIYRPLLAGLAERGIEVVEDEVASRSRASE